MSPPGKLRLDVDTFLARHWQREPLLIRGALTDFTPPIDAHELAGLAMEDGVESRIIEYVDPQWQLHQGPFAEGEFHRATPWTLLVQAVDHHVPEVARLRTLLDFLPRWRVDDVMVSYAVDGGSVGPHYDNYDVFLLQGEGQRRWRVGQRCDQRSPLLAHPQLRILAEFETQEEYLLEPGDMLYLPPGVAHWGIAEGACTTFSLGFRAPRMQDLVARFCDAVIDCIGDEQFYTDPGLTAAKRPGEIRYEDLQRVMDQVNTALQMKVGTRWLGELVTEPRYEPFPQDDELVEALHELRDGHCTVMLDTASRLAWQELATCVVVYANGESRDFSLALLPMLLNLCSEQYLPPGCYCEPEPLGLLEYLLQTGCVYVE